MSNDMDLNLVRVFVAIYETQSVTAAAERLDVTQPTISYGLSKLRKSYGDRLFLRSGSGVAPTSLAEQLYTVFRDALAAVDNTLEARAVFSPATSRRRFRLAMSDIGVLIFVPLLLRRFQEVAPHIEIEVISISETTGEDLAAGRLDVAIGNIPQLSSQTRSSLLFKEHYVGLMSATHPGIGGEMTLSQFLTARHVMVSSPRSGHALVEERLAQLGIHRNIVARVPHFTVLPELLSQSDLLVILPSRVANVYVGQGALKAMPLPVELPEFHVQVHWHRRQDTSVAHKWFIEETVRVLGTL
ncbi:LysR family transcriptional regulator [Hydrogenophaga sp. OTU3427]|uniref:LysR family transcriptional regulator n=1 Tax=Hydrogenophaga sp. OTU3427 TaxID=3043856 RepID=UPI00313D7183